MYKVGHYGAALVAYAPIGAAVAVAGYGPAAVVGGGVTVALSTIPDVDHRLPLIDHRGPTHSVLFALLVGVATAAASAWLVGVASPGFGAGLVAFGFLVGTVAILSHLAADALTPMGIRPFWPLSARHYSVNVVPASSTLGNYVLFALGVGATVAAVSVVSRLT